MRRGRTGDWELGREEHSSSEGSGRLTLPGKER